MAKTEWSTALEIGIPTIDKQHKKLLELLNEVASLASCASVSFHDVDDVFDELERYIAAHFLDEEALMESIDFEFLPEHQKEHHLLTQQVFEHRRAFSNGTMDIQSLYEWMLKWLIKHIAGSDSLIASAMSKNIVNTPVI